MPSTTDENNNNSPAIKPINKGVVHKICAGQVIIDLSSAIKELVENSLDAGATSVEISLTNYGLDSFHVIDNGFGISPDNFQVLALKHHTSKLADFPDLQSLTTFGFRGEALSSLCALGNVTVETRTKNETVASHLTFDHSGHLVAEKKTARQVGTTVTVQKLFSNLPVRSKEFSRNIRKEYGKLLSLLNAYAVIAKGVRLVCSNMSGKSARSVVLKTQGSGSLKDNIITLFGMSTFSCLEPLDISISDHCKVEGFISKFGYGSGRNTGDRQYFYVNSRPVDMPKVGKLVNELYRGANSRQFPIAILNFIVPCMSYDVNVTPDKRKIFFSDEGSILKSLRGALGMIYSANDVTFSVQNVGETSDKNVNSSPLTVEQSSKQPSPKIAQPKGICDEDSSEDKMIVDLTEKDFSMDHLDKTKKSLGKDFSLRSHRISKDYSYLVGEANLLSGTKSAQPCLKDSEKNISLPSSVDRLGSTQPPITQFVTLQKRKHENMSMPLSEVPILRNESVCCKSEGNASKIHDISVGTATKCDNDNISADCYEKDTSKQRRTDSDTGGTGRSSLYEKFSEVGGLTEGQEIYERTRRPPEGISSGGSAGGKSDDKQKDQLFGVHVVDNPGPSSVPMPSSTLNFSIKDLMKRRQQKLSISQPCISPTEKPVSKRHYAAATLELSQADNEERKARVLAAATTELERLFRKGDFSKMKVIGQFNLGFIIGKIDKDLFIVDQHAADEKYNFERLSQSTIMNQQPLLRPIRLELSPEEEVVALMHMDIIRKNGFSLEEDVCAPLGCRFKLTAVPFSKNITFGVEDVKELISTLSDGHGECSIMSTYKLDTAESICPSKVRAMLASRACRSSVMIGDALGRNEMKKILEHLAALKSPWNCPHGRPTMRHLVDLATIHERENPESDSLL